MRSASLCRGLLAAALLAGVSLALTAPAAAQETETAAAPQAQTQALTVSGCLAKSDEGGFHLTAESGHFLLTAASEEVNLAAHDGHQVEVTGTPGAVDPEAGEDAPRPLKVTAIKMLAESCGGN
jgi:hypothetical protein